MKEFTVVNCGMVHERVKIDNGNSIIYKTDDGYDCKRLSLCPKKVQDIRLGCAHTSSNFRFQNYLDMLCELYNNFEIYKDKLNSLLMAVFKLDHQKGELEKQLAIHLSEDKKTAGIKRQIQEAVSQHNELMEQLRELKQNIFALLEVKITD